MALHATNLMWLECHLLTVTLFTHPEGVTVSGEVCISISRLKSSWTTLERGEWRQCLVEHYHAQRSEHEHDAVDPSGLYWLASLLQEIRNVTERSLSNQCSYPSDRISQTVRHFLGLNVSKRSTVRSQVKSDNWHEFWEAGRMCWTVYMMSQQKSTRKCYRDGQETSWKWHTMYQVEAKRERFILRIRILGFWELQPYIVNLIFLCNWVVCSSITCPASTYLYRIIPLRVS